MISIPFVRMCGTSASSPSCLPGAPDIVLSHFHQPQDPELRIQRSPWGVNHFPTPSTRMPGLAPSRQARCGALPLLAKPATSVSAAERKLASVRPEKYQAMAIRYALSP